jgi:hypothetical protein
MVTDGYLDATGAPAAHAFPSLAAWHGPLLPLAGPDTLARWIMRMRGNGHMMDTFLLQLLVRGVDFDERLVRTWLLNAIPTANVTSLTSSK